VPFDDAAYDAIRTMYRMIGQLHLATFVGD
jgi:hypothetical protein